MPLDYDLGDRAINDRRYLGLQLSESGLELAVLRSDKEVAQYLLGDFDPSFTNTVLYPNAREVVCTWTTNPERVYAVMHSSVLFPPPTSAASCAPILHLNLAGADPSAPVHVYAYNLCRVTLADGRIHVVEGGHFAPPAQPRTPVVVPAVKAPVQLPAESAADSQSQQVQAPAPMEEEAKEEEVSAVPQHLALLHVPSVPEVPQPGSAPLPMDFDADSDSDSDSHATEFKYQQPPARPAPQPKPKSKRSPPAPMPELGPEKKAEFDRLVRHAVQTFCSGLQETDLLKFRAFRSPTIMGQFNTELRKFKAARFPDKFQADGKLKRKAPAPAKTTSVKLHLRDPLRKNALNYTRVSLNDELYMLSENAPVMLDQQVRMITQNVEFNKWRVVKFVTGGHSRSFYIAPVHGAPQKDKVLVKVISHKATKKEAQRDSLQIIGCPGFTLVPTPWAWKAPQFEAAESELTDFAASPAAKRRKVVSDSQPSAASASSPAMASAISSSSASYTV